MLLGSLLHHTHSSCHPAPCVVPPSHALLSLLLPYAITHPPPTHTERIEDRSLRRQYTSLASTCRLPYWDWTKPNLPSLLTASTVLVLDESGNEVETRNPFTPYQYVVSHSHSAPTPTHRQGKT